MNVLIIGSGGREHTFAWKITQSKLLNKLYVAPGNAGTAQIAENVDIDVLDFEKLAKFVETSAIDIVLVGPEVPLVAGLVDYFKTIPSLVNVAVVGPDKVAAQLEGSKDFSKKFMHKYNIPTASYRTFDSSQVQDGLDYLVNHTMPVVLKADGLAAGKGVLIIDNVQEAQKVLIDMLQENKFGEAGAKVVVEQFLDGIELSVFTISDGKNFLILPEAKDYKRIGEGDKGLNTGGMGAVSPVPFADSEFMQKIKSKIIIPTIEGLKKEGINYVGFIFFGLIKVKGEPYVIEYNARMGDPETEVVIPRIKNDLLEILLAVKNKNIETISLEVDTQTASTVMLVAGGYPEGYKKGDVISGLENISDALVFHAGTIMRENKVLTNGGRVIAITALGKSIEQAVSQSNLVAEKINWNAKYYRKDIGQDLIKYQVNFS